MRMVDDVKTFYNACSARTIYVLALRIDMPRRVDTSDVRSQDMIGVTVIDAARPAISGTCQRQLVSSLEETAKAHPWAILWGQVSQMQHYTTHLPQYNPIMG